MNLTVKEVFENNSVEKNVVIGVFNHLDYKYLTNWLYLLGYKWASGHSVEYTPSTLNSILSNKNGIVVIGFSKENKTITYNILKKGIINESDSHCFQDEFGTIKPFPIFRKELKKTGHEWCW